MTLAYDPERHEYRVDGHLLPHVTSVTDQLASAYRNVPDDVMEAARDRGNAVHLVTQLHDEGTLDESSVPAEIAPYLAAWRALLDETGFVPHAIEARVHSSRYGYAGTLDRVGNFYKLLSVRLQAFCLLDIKATAAVLPMVGPQTAAYAAAWDEMQSDPTRRIRHRYCAWLRGDGTYKLISLTDRTDLSVFLAGLTLENWRARHGQD